MVGVIAATAQIQFGFTMSLKRYPFDPPKVGKNAKGEEPIFLTYVGGDAGLLAFYCPAHGQAYYDIRDIFTYRLATVIAGKYKGPSKPEIDSKGLRHLKRIDANGNTILNRLLMSHVALGEESSILAYRALNKRNLITLRPNKNGQTPLMLAVEAGWPPLVSEILKLHPNMDAKDRQGHDAIDYLAYCQLRPDNNIAANKVIFNAEGIAESLLSHVSSSKRPEMQARALKILTEIRKQDFDSGIHP